MFPSRGVVLEDVSADASALFFLWDPSSFKPGPATHTQSTQLRTATDGSVFHTLEKKFEIHPPAF